VSTRARTGAASLAELTAESGWSGPGLLALTMGIAAALRFWHLGRQSLWADEFASLLTALASPANIPAQALRNDAFEPPLYFWLLHGVMQATGPSEWGLRLLSAIAGTLTVPVVWLLLRDCTRSARIGHTGALLLAANPLHLWYSQEARPYALALLFGSAALLCLTRALHAGRIWWWIGFTVLSAVTILTHPTGVVFPLIGALWAICTRGSRVLGALASASAGILGIILPFLMTLATAVRHAESTGSPQRPFTGLELPYSIFTFVAGYSFGPPVREIQDVGWRVALADHLGQTMLVGAMLLALLALLFRTRPTAMLQLGLLFVIPLAAAGAGSLLTTKAYNVRYVLPALIGFLGLVAIAVDRLPRRSGSLALNFSLGLFLWSDMQWFWLPSYSKDDTRAAAACLAESLPRGSTVVVAPSYMRGLVEHYTPPASGLRIVGVTAVGSPQASGAAALAITRPFHLEAPVGELVRGFQSRAGREVSSGQVPGYQLYFATRLSQEGPDPSCTASRPGTP